MDVFKSTKDAIPFDCLVKFQGTLHVGEVQGSMLTFPVVVFDNGRKIEISWDLAKRLYTKKSPYVSAD